MQCLIDRCPTPRADRQLGPSARWHNNRSSTRSRMAQLYEKVELRDEGELSKIQQLLQDALDGRAKVGRAEATARAAEGQEIKRGP